MPAATRTQTAAQVDSPPAPTPLRPPRRRRSRLLILFGIVLSALCAGAAVGIYRSSDTTISAVGVATAVRYGEEITESALREVRVPADAGLAPIPWDRRLDLVGRIAATDLLPGGIVTAEVVQDGSLPGPGQELIGVATRLARLPATRLLPRQPVLLVPSGLAGASADAWEPVRAAVFHVGEPDPTGVRVVDVTVPTTVGPALATRASTGNVAIVLLGS